MPIRNLLHATVSVLAAVFVSGCSSRYVELPLGGTVTGVSGLYTLTTVDPSWRQRTHELQSDHDLQLLYGEGDVDLSVTLHRVAGVALDDVVRYRRRRILSAVRLSTIYEERFFVPDSDHVSASIAHYLGDPGPGALLVFTAQLDGAVVEAVALARSYADIQTTDRILRSFRVASPEVAP